MPRGEEIEQGELLRWLGETPWFPTTLLPSGRIRGESLDNSSAKAFLTNKNLTVEGTFYFNERGQAIRFKAKRYKDNTLENWTGYYRDFRTINGMRIPFYVEVVWNLGILFGDLPFLFVHGYV